MRIYKQDVAVSLDVEVTINGRPVGPKCDEDGYAEVEIEEWSKNTVITIDGEEYTVGELPERLQKQLWVAILDTESNEYWD